MTHKETGQEITFVSTADDGTKRYTFDLVGLPFTSCISVKIVVIIF